MASRFTNPYDLNMNLHRCNNFKRYSVCTELIVACSWRYSGIFWTATAATVFCRFLSRKKKLHGLSPRANYTNRATAACRRSDCQLLRIEGATWSAWRIPKPYSGFSRQEPLLFYQVAPQLYSRGWVDPVPDPLLFFSVSAGNRTQASGSVAKNSDH
jgi:hypothetical protein